MKQTDPDAKVVTGVLIGGLVGVGAIAIFLALRTKESSVEHIGKVVSNVGEILESHHVDEPNTVKKIGKTLQQNENVIGAVVDWMAQESICGNNSNTRGLLCLKLNRITLI